MNDITFVGLDVHKDTIAVAVARSGWGDPQSLGIIRNTPDDVAKLVRRLCKPENLFVCYEAGPCGYGLYRQLTAMGAGCMVAAPSLIPQRPGERVKTDRRDAKKLARLLRSGDLTPVWVPDEDQEALRDLVRAREDAKEDRLRHRHQLTKFLLRLDLRPPEGVNRWTIKYRQWLDGLELKHPAQRAAFREYIYALDEAQSRLERLEKEVEVLVQDSRHAGLAAALQAFRGIAVVTAATLVAELGDITRFNSPRQLMSYAGVVPSEHSSGRSQHRGSITKTGNAHVRRVIVEAAWHYRHKPRVSKTLRKRQEGLSQEIRDIAWKAQGRLHGKFYRLVGRGKPRQKAVVAIARELLGFVWAVAQAQAKMEAAVLAAD